MPKFRKKPVVIDAMQWDGGNPMPVLVWAAAFGGEAQFIADMGKLAVVTLEGDLNATAGDWIIRGVKGEFYPCKPEIFAATYEAVPATGENQQ